jgi:hypothetical protein
MKSMTCKQLGGACDKVFRAETFDEIAGMSQNHGMEMFRKGDVAHLDAMNKMLEITQSAEFMKKWMENKRREFDALPAIK